MVFSMCMSLMCIAALVIGAEDLKPRSKRQYLEFKVLSQKQLVVKMGQNAVLKYELDPADTAKHVKLEVKCYWSQPETLPENMCLNPTLPQLSFNKRIYLVKDYINQGYVELRIDDVELSDERTYSCCFRAPNRVHDASTHLSVEAIGSGPTINIGKTHAGVELDCSASDWHRDPEIWWEGSSVENQTSDLPPARMTVARAGNYTCHVKNQRLNTTKSTTVSVQDSLLQNPSCVFPWILLCIAVAALILYHIKVKKGSCIERIWSWFLAKICKETKQQVKEEGKMVYVAVQADAENENHQNERESRTLQDGPAPFTEVTVTLEEDSASSHLDIRSNQKSVKLKGDAMSEERGQPVAFGKGGFTEGKHFWKVHVGEANMWALGVAEESVKSTMNSNLLEEEGTRAVGLTAGQYQSFTPPLTKLSPDPHPVTLVVYLDIGGGQLSFYNADPLRHIHTDIICFREKVFPFIWTMDQKNWITVSPPQSADTSDRHSEQY